MRLINADILLDRVEWANTNPLLDHGETAVQLIKNAPTIEERKTGEWINVTNDESLDEEYECSVCGYELFYSYPTKFCPNCGSRMENEKCKEM